MESIKSLLALIIPFGLSILLGSEFTPETSAQLMTSIVGLLTLVPVITEAFNEALKLHKWKARLMSWFVAEVLTFVAWWLNWLYPSLQWYEILFVGLLIGFAANGYFTISFIQWLLAHFTLNTQKVDRLTSPKF